MNGGEFAVCHHHLLRVTFPQFASRRTRCVRAGFTKVLFTVIWRMTLRVGFDIYRLVPSQRDKKELDST